MEKVATPINEQELKKVMSKPMIKTVDMTAETSSEALEIITMAVDKYAATKNYESAAQLIKTQMDKKFGTSWQCAIGEGFGFDVQYQQRNMIFVYYGVMAIGILLYKC